MKKEKPLLKQDQTYLQVNLPTFSPTKALKRKYAKADSDARHKGRFSAIPDDLPPYQSQPQLTVPPTDDPHPVTKSSDSVPSHNKNADKEELHAHTVFLEREVQTLKMNEQKLLSDLFSQQQTTKETLVAFREMSAKYEAQIRTLEAPIEDAIQRERGKFEVPIRNNRVDPI